MKYKLDEASIKYFHELAKIIQFTHFCRNFDFVAKYAFSQAPSFTNFSLPGSASDSRTGSISEQNGTGKSLGTSIGKIWYQEKVSEPISEKFGTAKSLGTGIGIILIPELIFVAKI